MEVSKAIWPPGGKRCTPRKEKPGVKPGFRKNSETHYTSLPPHAKAAHLLTLLRERHPVIQSCLPLSIGIHQVVSTAYPEFSKTAIWRALKFRTHSRTYLKNLAAGGYCYDLTGQPWGRITPKHQQQAKEKLAAKRKGPKQNQRSPKPEQQPQAAKGSEAIGPALASAMKTAGRTALSLKKRRGRS